MKFILADGKIKFLSHKVEWQDKRKQFNTETKKMEDVLSNVKSQEFWSAEAKDRFIARLAENDITPTVTAIDQPSVELLASCEDKTFSSYDDALAFVETGVVAKTELEILRETVDALLLASLEV